MNATVQFKAPVNKDDQSAAKQSFVFVPTTAVRDQNGAKIVFIAYNNKALLRDVHVKGERSDGCTGRFAGGRRKCHHDCARNI
jgi:hypothetical protein